MVNIKQYPAEGLIGCFLDSSAGYVPELGSGGLCWFKIFDIQDRSDPFPGRFENRTDPHSKFNLI